ncbi:MAG: hypothetical protein SP1CHLAM54_07070 [Chlamydiia bacterium]|nr:hypothetical protein [Chlamydiia bacterium]MCH9615613.1 hypothetical protein [Chlamydiia bacterium]MCH9628984.1 hypothetical protein [Chlamydiia bacterium]
MADVSIRVCNFGEISTPLNNECAITMNDFETTTSVVELACKHIFEEEAITTWVQRDATCPTCRRAVDLTQIRTQLHLGDRSNSCGYWNIILSIILVINIIVALVFI